MVNIAEAQQRTNSVFRFLNLETDARAAALGGHHAAYIEPDFQLFTQNPAFLESEQRRNFQISYQNHLSDINTGSAAYFHDFGTYGKAAATVQFVTYGDLTRFDEAGTDLGSLSANDLALTLGWGTALTDQLSYGLSVSGIYSSLGGFQSTAVSFSGGLFYRLTDRTVLGAALTHAGTQISTFNGVREPLPLNLAVSAVHKPADLPFRFYLTLQRLTEWGLENGNDESISTAEELFRHTTFGTELLLGQRVTARIGYDHWLQQQANTGGRLDAAGFAFGLGIRANRFDLNLSRTSFSDLGSVVQLSLNASL